MCIYLGYVVLSTWLASQAINVVLSNFVGV